MKPKKYLTIDDLPKICGLYFLLSKKKVVYIGVTKNLISRLIAHKSDGKKFDSFRLIECPIRVAIENEKRWIVKFRPKYNSVFVWKFMGHWSKGPRRRVRYTKKEKA